METQRDGDVRFRRASEALHRALERREKARKAYLLAQEQYAQALAVFDELLTERVDEAGLATLDPAARDRGAPWRQTPHRQERPL